MFENKDNFYTFSISSEKNIFTTIVNSHDFTTMEFVVHIFLMSHEIKLFINLSV